MPSILNFLQDILNLISQHERSGESRAHLTFLAIRIIQLKILEQHPHFNNTPILQAAGTTQSDMNSPKEKNDEIKTYYRRIFKEINADLYFTEGNLQDSSENLRIASLLFEQLDYNLFIQPKHIRDYLTNSKKNSNNIKQYIHDLMGLFEPFQFSMDETSIGINGEIDETNIVINPLFLSTLFELAQNPEIKMFSGSVYTNETEIKIMVKLSLIKYLIDFINMPSDLAIAILSEPQVFDNEIHSNNSNITSNTELSSIVEKMGSNSSNADFAFPRILERYLEMRILEPSCGSGAFLIELINYTSQFYRNLCFAFNINESQADIIPDKEFLRIFISQCLFAVDINPLASNISRFRILMRYFSTITASDHNNQKEIIVPTLNIETGDFLYTPFAIDPKQINKTDIQSELQSILDLRRENYPIGSDTMAKVQSEKGINRKDQIRKIQLNILRKIGIEDLRREEFYDINNVTDYYQGMNSDTHKYFSMKNPHFSIYLDFCDVILSGGFQMIIGNPPYIRQEKIVPDNFTKDSEILKYKKDLEQQIGLRNLVKYQNTEGFDENSYSFSINLQSDYLIYFFLGSFPLLSPGGIHCFITSNSWLDVGYGMDFQNFLLKNMDLDLILDCSMKRSFESAEINTVISLITAKQQIRIAPDPVETNPSKHPINLLTMVQNRTQNAQSQAFNVKKQKAKNETKGMVKHVKFLTIHFDYNELLQSENFNQIISNNVFKDSVSNETDLFRIRVIPQDLLLEMGYYNGKFEGVKWGNFLLRAPLIFDKLLKIGPEFESLKDVVLRLNEIFEVKGGIKSGANKFFLLEIVNPDDKPKGQALYVKNGYGHEFFMEERFLRPILQTPKDIEFPRFHLNQKILNIRIFYCSLPKSELKGTHALEYINWAEKYEVMIEKGKDRGKMIRGIHTIKTFANKKPWYSLSLEGFPIAIQKIYNEAFRFVVSEDSIISFDNFHLLKIQNKWKAYSIPIMATFLSSLRVFGINLFGRANFGAGALDLKVFELVQIPFINPQLFTDEENKRMEPHIESILNRKILPYREELLMDDLWNLDRIVFSKVSLSEPQIIKFRETLSNYIDMRLLKANKLKLT